MRFLIVDDSSTMRRIITDTLNKLGHQDVQEAGANRLAHRYGFGCTADSANLLEDPVCTKVGLSEAWLADLDRRAPGLFQVARQIVA